ALRQDRARVQFGSISKFGLLEMSRQRLKPMLSEGASIPCPRCGGSGHIRDTESSALQILRVIQEESLKDSTAAVLVQVPVEVASFLLNEKRTEITKIELKQRINVLLVPNKSLDTPNYKLERLKHDDPRLDNLDVSYKMAEEVDDVASFTRRSQERTNKQEPVIKGVLPDGPAPVAAPRPEVPASAPVAAAPALAPVAATAPAAAPAEKGFFAWLKGLFGMGSTPPAAAPVSSPVAKPAESKAREERPDGRRGARGSRGGSEQRRGQGEGREGGPRQVRGEGRGEARAEGQGRQDGRNEGRGGEARRSERPDNRNNGQRRPRDGQANELAPAQTAPVDASERPSVDAGDQAGRQQRRGRGDGRRRPEGTEAPASQPATDTHAEGIEQVAGTAAGGPEADNAGEGTPRAPRERRSRDRYGRDRRDRTAQQAGDALALSAESPVTEAAEAEPAAPVRSSYFTMPVDDQAQAAPAAAAESVPAPAPAPVQVTAAQVPAPAGLPKVAPYTLSVAELAQVARDSGLEWVNSDADKVAAVQAAIAAEPLPIHVPREPRPSVVVDEGPLVLVETRKDLRQVTLPFEQQA
ncbi:MAG: ribonuclease E/G, partial [Hydrogenophaga sp.]|nr:ribonuclease E/G [Hydrogenophaga sp.]